MNWVRHGSSATFETKSSYCRVATQSLPCYTTVARLGFKRRATAVLKSNLIRSVEFGTAVHDVWNGPQPFCKHLCQCVLVPVFLGNPAPSWIYGRGSHLFPFPVVPRTLSIFPLLLFLLGYPAGTSAEERELLPFSGTVYPFMTHYNQAQKAVPTSTIRAIQIPHFRNSSENGYKLWAQWFPGPFEWASISYDRSMVFTATINH